MAVKWLRAFGAEVTVVSTSPSKRDEALERLGAHKFVVRCAGGGGRRPGARAGGGRGGGREGEGAGHGNRVLCCAARERERASRGAPPALQRPAASLAARARRR